MPKITYIADDGQQYEVEADIGTTVMENAVKNSVPGIEAECGGACACATCHIYVDDAWAQKLPAMDDMEDAMLDSAMERRPNSRLSCQIEASDDLDGLAITIADNEG